MLHRGGRGRYECEDQQFTSLKSEIVDSELWWEILSEGGQAWEERGVKETQGVGVPIFDAT